MLIRKLTLTNFRQFIGEQTVVFSTDMEKNVTVFVGDNTAGKTTFINAFQWILYDNTSFADKVLLNKDIANKMSVGEHQSVTGLLEIEHDDTVFEILRRYDYICTHKSEVNDGIVGEAVVKFDKAFKQISYLQKDGQTKTNVESLFEENISRILPKELSEYFFFDGEKIGAISSKASIKKSVTGLMGLNVLDNALRHLKLVKKAFESRLDYSGDTKALDYQSKIDGYKVEIDAHRKRIEEISDQLSFYSGERDKYIAQLKAYAETAELQKKRETLSGIIKSLTRDMDSNKANIVKAFGDGGFAFFSRILLKDALNFLQSTSDLTESVPAMEGPAIDFLINRKRCICGTVITPGSMAEQMLIAERKKVPPEHIGDVVRKYKEKKLCFCVWLD